MSVVFYACSCCGESVYEEYVGHCSKCGHSLCTNCLINNDIHSSYAYDYGVKFNGSEEHRINPKYYEIGDILDDVGIDSKYCPFCSVDEVNNDDLLDFAIEKLKTTKDNLIKLYKKIKSNMNL